MNIGEIGLESGSNRAIIITPPDREDDKLLECEFEFIVVIVAQPLDTTVIRGKRKKRSSNEVSSNHCTLVAVSNFLKNANEDVLLEIFLRLPNCRSAILFGSVCRPWHALISQPQFIPRFIGLHPDPSYTILFTRRYDYVGNIPEYLQPVCTIFSNESWLLHGKHATSSSYLDFLPFPMIIRASFNDLLLVSPDPHSNGRRSSSPKYYICNPVTKQWFLVPGEVPHATRIGFALICMPNCHNGYLPNSNNEFSTNAQYQYKVVLIQIPRAPNPGEEGDCRTTATVFCSRSGQWSQSYFAYPRRAKYDYTNAAKEVVTCNGMLYWMDGCDYLDRILALDLSNSHCGVIYFPDVIYNDISNVKVHLGVVSGELRLLHICRIGGSGKCFVMKVWELNYKDNSWLLVHERNLKAPNTDEKMVSVSFHPKNCDVVFMIWGIGVFEYRISEDICHKVGELQESIGDEGLVSFTLLHPAWPTPVPSHFQSI